MEKLFTDREDTSIPFGIKLTEGRTIGLGVEFENGFRSIFYKDLCKDNNGDYWVFRTEEDAKMAAEGNNWEYINVRKSLELGIGMEEGQKWIDDQGKMRTHTKK